jgi:hypothetical protein
MAHNLPQEILLVLSVPNWPILPPHNSKGAVEIVSGRTNLWQNFGRIIPEMAEKGPNILNVLYPVFFPFET